SRAVRSSTRSSPIWAMWPRACNRRAPPSNMRQAVAWKCRSRKPCARCCSTAARRPKPCSSSSCAIRGGSKEEDSREEREVDRVGGDVEVEVEEPVQEHREHPQARRRLHESKPARRRAFAEDGAPAQRVGKAEKRDDGDAGDPQLQDQLRIVVMRVVGEADDARTLVAAKYIGERPQPASKG